MFIVKWNNIMNLKIDSTAEKKSVRNNQGHSNVAKAYYFVLFKRYIKTNQVGVSPYTISNS